MLYRAGKAEYERSLKTKSITSASMGIPWGNAGTASWSDRGIMQPVRQYAYQELTYTAYGKVRRRKAKASRTFPPVSYERAKTVVERERKKVTRKRHQYFCRSLKGGRKRSKEDARKEHENATNISAGL